MVADSFRQCAWVMGLLLYGAVLSVACTKASQGTSDPGKDVVIFVDFSGSIGPNDKTLFARDITEQIIPELDAGDRILIAPINDRTLTGFQPLVEATFPSKPNFNKWTDNTLHYNRQVKVMKEEVAELKEKVRAQVSSLFARPISSQETDIFSSLLIAEKLFHKQARRKVLVLMSDMIVDYGPFRFEKIPWNGDTNEQILSELEAKNFIPDLSGVCVYVTGVSARSADLAKNIGDFWQFYFEKTKADMDPSRYAHVLLHWPPSQSCHV